MMQERGGSTRDWRASAAYDRAMRHWQRAEWADALAALQELAADYPDEPGVQDLIDKTRLRIETDKTLKVRARRLPLLNRRTLFVLALVVVLFGLAWIALGFYQSTIAPSLAQMRAERQQAEIALQAAQALAAGDYAQALTLYDQLATLNPEYPALAEGIASTRQGQELDAAYQEAQAQLAAGQIAEAQATLVGILEITPTYRDVSALLGQIEKDQRLLSVLRQAEDTQAAGDLEGAVLQLEEARTLTPRTERTEIDVRLFQAYLTLAGQVVDQSKGRVDALQHAEELYTKALGLRPQDPAATNPRDWARQYMDGYAAFTAGQWDLAIRQLGLLYANQPGYLDNQATQLLYDAYMRSGDALLQAGELAMAWERYFRASQLEGMDTTTARTLAASLATQMTPTVTPTPTSTLTPAPTAMPEPTATPTPGYVPLSRYKGKIVYYSNRTGSDELWIMNPDGSRPFHIWQQDKAQAEYEKLRAAELRSPDGLSSLYVTKPRNEKNPKIYILYPDGTSRQITEGRGMNYDPVWSPAGHWIAYVSNETGNDEIFLIGADGEHPKRLTKNDWEWDKHPSWSPDGGRLVFWSNRVTGYAQIWLMNDDGSYQTNLSNNKFEERDPIWIK